MSIKLDVINLLKSSGMDGLGTIEIAEALNHHNAASVRAEIQKMKQRDEIERVPNGSWTLAEKDSAAATQTIAAIARKHAARKPSEPPPTRLVSRETNQETIGGAEQLTCYEFRYPADGMFTTIEFGACTIAISGSAARVRELLRKVISDDF